VEEAVIFSSVTSGFMGFLSLKAADTIRSFRGESLETYISVHEILTCYSGEIKLFVALHFMSNSEQNFLKRKRERELYYTSACKGI
jgi:hypothetical protein